MARLIALFCDPHCGPMSASPRRPDKREQPASHADVTDRSASEARRSAGAIVSKEAEMSDLKQLPREERAKRYWQANQRLILILLAIWFLVTYVQVLFVNQLNGIVIGGFPLGYYMGSQGSLIVFVVEIFYYAYAMNRLDDQFGLSDRDR